jgi:peptidoglycan/xylan/chitin deacetylase (PgdA/CDA1 family)/CelD/BcsL family acetyltransferase involved in cellulose biosynthesis
MKLVEVRREAELDQLRGEWNRLVCQSGSRTIFLTWEWITAWWSAYGSPGDLRILALFDDGGVLRGIAPLRRQSVRRYGQTVQALSFVGDGSIGSDLNDSDYLDFIAEPGFEKDVIEAVGKHCAEEFRSGVALLNEIPETSPNLEHLQELARSQRMGWTESDVPCATVRLPATWDEYLKMLQPRFRTKIRSTLRNLESRPEVRMRFCDDVRQLDRILPVLFDLHTRRWKREGKPGVFGWDRKREFYFILSRLLLERQWLRLSWLEWNGRILACQFGFAYAGIYSQLQEGYDPDTEHWNPGVGLRAWTIGEFLKEGLKEYDFLGGVSRHKTDWGAEVKHSKRIVLTGGIYPNLLFRRGPEWEGAARESVRKLLPEKLLAHGKALQSRGGDSGGAWARNTAASCYFHGGLATVTRPLRKRYQVAIEAGGKVSWKKRTHSSARILYYHSVNDNKDPFSDAISTQLFEEHVRYLARNYKVVRMSEIMRHLAEGDSPEMLVGITFDDGYADNYQNAFPILQRYGVPATIFLTTGGLDSGEALWFERLADAVQKTSKEFIDLEIDIPRRFWMRTLTERVDANNRIFSLLRTLENSARTFWLTRILDGLGAGKETLRKNNMLSWDQVRSMNAKGIDFGGHTVTHPFLSRLTPAEAAWEVSECKRRIEQELQQPVDYFAYPNGREEDIAGASKEVLRTAGYRAAVTTIWGMNDEFTDHMELKRGGPWESNPALFAAKLDWYQLVNQ